MIRPHFGKRKQQHKPPGTKKTSIYTDNHNITSLATQSKLFIQPRTQGQGHGTKQTNQPKARTNQNSKQTQVKQESQKNAHGNSLET